MQERADAAVLLQRQIRVLGRGHDLARALEDRLLEELAAGGRLLHAQARERGEMVGREGGDDDDDQRRHAGNLADLMDNSGFRPALVLHAVQLVVQRLQLMPRISAARVLLLRV